MKKRIKEILGKKNYLLGAKNGEKYWLEEASWDCDWYWGFGYVEAYNYHYTDINSHQHFGGLFLDPLMIYKDNDSELAFIDFFDETPLTKKEVWSLLEYMRAIYATKKYSDLLHTGGAHISTNKVVPLFEKDNMIEYKRINKVLLPALFKEVYSILNPEKKEVK